MALNKIIKPDLLILDDLGIIKLAGKLRSSVNLATASGFIWPAYSGVRFPPILDRIVHNSYKIEVGGDSMRKIFKFTQGRNHRDNQQ